MNIIGISITRTGKAPAPDYSGMTLQQQFQERYGKTAVNDLFKAFDFVKRAIMIVTWVAMGISYFHQKHYFESRGAGPFSWVIPVSIDCVMLVFMKISQLPAIKASNRWIARGILVLPAGGSMAINFMATEDLVLRWVYVGVVGAIVICEIGHGLMVPNLAAMEEKQAEISASATKTPRLDPVTAASRTEKARITREWNKYQALPEGGKAKYRREHGAAPERPAHKSRTAVTVKTPKAPAAASNIPTSPGMPPVGELVDAYH